MCSFMFASVKPERGAMIRRTTFSLTRDQALALFYQNANVKGVVECAVHMVTGKDKMELIELYPAEAIEVGIED